VWWPENFEGTSSGPHTLRYGSSIHQSDDRAACPRCRHALIAEYAKRFGIYDDLPPYLANSLGAGETTLMRLTTAYSMLANGGKRIKKP
jgi:penicillin-binding protein 1A